MTLTPGVSEIALAFPDMHAINKSLHANHTKRLIAYTIKLFFSDKREFCHFCCNLGQFKSMHFLYVSNMQAKVQKSNKEEE